MTPEEINRFALGINNKIMTGVLGSVEYWSLFSEKAHGIMTDFLLLLNTSDKVKVYDWIRYGKLEHTQEYYDGFSKVMQKFNNRICYSLFQDALYWSKIFNADCRQDAALFLFSLNNQEQENVFLHWYEETFGFSNVVEEIIHVVEEIKEVVHESEQVEEQVKEIEEQVEHITEELKDIFNLETIEHVVEEVKEVVQEVEHVEEQVGNIVEEVKEVIHELEHVKENKEENHVEENHDEENKEEHVGENNDEENHTELE